MLEKELEIRCGDKIIATKALIPETETERARGMYKYKAVPGMAMMFLRDKDLPQLYDMLWIREKLGFIAVNENHYVVDVGILKPWFSFKMVTCMYFIETVPEAIKGINKGDKITWQEKDIDKQKICTTLARGQETLHPAMQ